MALGWVSGGPLVASWWLPGGPMVSTWWLPGVYLVAPWWPSRGPLEAVRCLPGGPLVTLPNSGALVASLPGSHQVATSSPLVASWHYSPGFTDRRPATDGVVSQSRNLFF